MGDTIAGTAMDGTVTDGAGNIFHSGRQSPGFHFFDYKHAVEGAILQPPFFYPRQFKLSKNVPHSALPSDFLLYT